jgi:DNA modification methylase
MRGVSNECSISTERERERESRVCRLIQGDCLEVLKKIPDNSIDLILTDIPFNISKPNNLKTMKDRKGRNGIDFGEWDKGFNEETLLALPRLLKTNGSLVIFHAFEQYSILLKLFDDYLELKDRLIWEKSNPMPRNRDRRYINNIEMFSWYVNKKAKWTFNRQNEKYDGCIFRYPSESGGGFKRYQKWRWI